VKPVLCFTNAYVDVRRPVKGVTVTRLGYLNKFLAKQARIVEAEDVERVVRVLQCWLTRHEREARAN
jgi:hypothetical protein